MKTHRPSTTARAFTLIEMLVVITIIGVLAAISFPVFNAVTARAKKLQVIATVKDLLVAIKGYQTEYGRYPSVSTDGGGSTQSDTTTTTEADNPLISALLGQEDTVNPKGIPFLEAKISKDGRLGGLILSDDTYALVDTFPNKQEGNKGSAYNVIMDTNYDNQIENPSSGSESESSSNLPIGVAVFSNGPDSQPDTSDDIKSW